MPDTTSASATRNGAAQLLDWVVSTTNTDLLLPEQVSPLLASTADGPSTSGPRPTT